MALEDFLRPDETIQYRSLTAVEYQGDSYDFYITNARLIWHKRKGLVFKKDKFVAAVKEHVTEIRYEEKGLVRKKAFITVVMGNKEHPFTGSIPNMRAIYSEMQPYMPEPKV